LASRSHCISRALLGLRSVGESGKAHHFNKGQSMLKFLVLSDLHLVDEHETSHGLDTHLRLAKAVEWINSRHGDADFCVLAGDLADIGFKGAVAPYARLKSLLSRLSVPCHITIGNHDNRDIFLSVFGENLRAETGCIDKVIDAKGHRVILLDSVLEHGNHSHGGQLSARQLDWLKARLAEHSGPVVVVLHHHANPLHVRVDRIILENGQAFVDVLKTHDDIRQVIAGHVHFTSCGVWQGIPFTTLAGNHYNVTVPLDSAEKVDRLWGPAQMAVVLGDADQTLVHFDNYLDGNPVLG
jgi:3',5'-cyclic AMP phosphodiesterase CpdA